MAPVLRAIIVDSDADSRAALRRLLAATPSVVVVGEFSRIAEASGEAPARRPDVLIAEIPYERGANGEGWSCSAIEQLARAMPNTAIFATGPSVSADFVIQVIRAGALEFLPRPVERQDLVAALDKVTRFRWGAVLERRARVISVFSTKGGLGVTTLATNLAVCLAARGRGETLLVDMDTRQSDIVTFLNLRPKYSVLDALENIDRMDESFLRGLLIKHASGLWVLPGPSGIERIQFTAEQVQAGLAIIRSHFDHVVLDLRHDVDPGTVAALEASDPIFFLTSLNVSALRAGAAGLAAFRQLGLDLQKVKIVVMREGAPEDVTFKQAREVLGLPIYWKTPSDYPAVVSSINSGQPVVTASPRSKVAKNLRQLAEMVPNGSGAGAEVPAKPSASRLRRVWAVKALLGAG